jgi:hypothetical protein
VVAVVAVSGFTGVPVVAVVADDGVVGSAAPAEDDAAGPPQEVAKRPARTSGAPSWKGKRRRTCESRLMGGSSSRCFHSAVAAPRHPQDSTDLG